MPEVIEESIPLHSQRPDALPESLKNRISVGDMGTRLVRDTFPLPPPKPASQAADPSGAAFDELLSFVFRYYSDLPDETLAAAADGVIAIMHDSTLRDDARKVEVESLLDEKLSISAFNELHSITSRITNRASSSVGGEDDIAELLDELADSESSLSDTEPVSSENAFVDINDPIQLRSQNVVRPQDIDAHWLEGRLKAASASISVDDILRILSEDQDVESALIAVLGVEHAALAHLVASNSQVILWYTRLHRAQNGTEREDLLEEIYRRGLSLEALAQNELSEQMALDPPPIVDLAVAGRPVSVSGALNMRLPEGSTRFTTRTYEQYDIPAAAAVKPDWHLRPVSDLPAWAQSAFAGVEYLNPVQSRASGSAVDSDVNMLLCAPTGAGKTNVALLALARCLHQELRAVYIAPLKALVQEQVRTLQERLPEYAISELSGDSSLSKDQLTSTDVLVATPEKWDIVTRKASNTELLRSIGLVVIDEIHLLHDETRGSVLENIVARHIAGVEKPRLLGLSATLPNYTDIAEFLQVPPPGLFHFGAMFRPVPLRQKYIGVTGNSPFKIMKAINEACAEKVAECLTDGKQILVFVHSRKDTLATARLLTEHEATKDLISKSEVAIHHAGLNREERAVAESSFMDRKLKVLVCTATLAWGVNLPAAAVIIKGTQYYDPGQDGWRQLQPQDVLQMLGRAGRPGFDTTGLGVILTEHKHLSYFASIATMNLPIQSHLIRRVLESLNAEVSFGSVRSLNEAVMWLERTFWYVRSIKEPGAYGMTDVTTASIAHSALRELAKLNAIVYEFPHVRSTFQGRISSDFYLSPNSVDTYCKQMKPWLSEIDLLRIFALSAEFASLPVRRGEEAEIARLSSLVPLPVRDKSSSRVAKVCVLAQAYICRLRLDGLALSADLVYVAQSATRILRALFQLAVARRWSRLAVICLHLYVAVDKRQWYAGQTAFRQFPGCPSELIKRAESSQLPWKRYFDLAASSIGDALRLQSPEVADIAVKYLSWFPRFELQARPRPLTRKILQLDIKVTPLFEFKKDIHEFFEQFYLMIEDQSGSILEWKALRLSNLLKSGDSVKRVVVFMPSDKNDTYLFARVLSDRWLHSETAVAINLRSVLLPTKSAEPMTLEMPAPETQFSNFQGFENLSLVQRAMLPLLYGSDANTYVGLPPGTENSLYQNMVIARALDNNQRVLFVTPKSMRWIKKFAETFNSRCSVSHHVESSDAEVCFTTPAKLETFIRRDNQSQHILGQYDVVVCDSLQRLGESSTNGWQYEAALTRIFRRSSDIRIVGFGVTLAAARSMGQWIGAKRGDVANLSRSSGLGAPSVEVRHWDDSLVLGLRGLDHDFESEASLLMIAADEIQCALLAEEVAHSGCPESFVLTEAALESDEYTPGSHRVVIGTIDKVLDTHGLSAEKVVLFGTRVSETGSNVPIADVLELLSTASCEFIIYTDSQQYYATFVTEPLPVESCLAENLIEALSSEIGYGRVSEPQDAVDWLVSTYLYRRLRHNPSYYGSENLEEYISDVVEDSFEKLAQMGAVELEDETLNVKPLAPAHIANHYGVNVTSLIDSKRRVLMKSWKTDSDENLSSVRLLDARADLAIAQGDLASFFLAADARQSIVQSVRVGASPLLQIPYISDERALKCQDAGVTSVQDFVAIEDDDLRSSLLGFDNDDPRMLEVANFVNHFPIVDIVSASISGEVVDVVIERDIEDEDDVKVVGRDLPSEISDHELWYIVIGDFEAKAIFGSKKVRIASPEARFQIPLSGTSANLSAWLVCNSYIDADKELSVTER